MSYKEIIRQVAEKLNIPEEVVKDAYMSYWKFIKIKIKEMPIRKDMTEEELKALRPSFNVPSLGKFYCNKKRLDNLRKEEEIIKKVRDAKNKKD